jgi:MFS family permease
MSSDARQPTRSAADRYKWELLALLSLAFFFHQADRAIFGAVLSAIRSDLHLTDGQLGMVGSVLFFTLAVMMPFTGYLGDVCSKKWIITISLVFWSGATMLTGLTRGLWGLVLFRSVATAGGESFYAPAAYSLLGAYHQRTRAFAMSVHQSAVYLGVMVSGYLAGKIAEQFGWRAAFYVFGSLGVFLGVLFVFRLKDAPPLERAPQEGGPARIGPLEALGVLFRTPTALLLTVGFTAIVFVNNAYVVWAPEFVREKTGLTLAAAGGHAMFYHHLAALVGVLIGGRLSDSVSVAHPRFRLQMQSLSMLLGAPAIFMLGTAGGLGEMCGAMIVFGLCRGFYEANTHASLFDVIEPRYRASAVAMMVMLGFLAGSISPWLLGRMRETAASTQGLAAGFTALSAAYLIGALAVAAALMFTFDRDRYVERTVE